MRAYREDFFRKLISVLYTVRLLETLEYGFSDPFITFKRGLLKALQVFYASISLLRYLNKFSMQSLLPRALR